MLSVMYTLIKSQLCPRNCASKNGEDMVLTLKELNDLFVLVLPN